MKMPKRGKKYQEAKAKIDNLKQYKLDEAIDLLKNISTTKFNASVEIAIKTNANPKYNDQAIRSTVVLPHGTGKTKKIAAFVSDDNKNEAKKAGADIVGNEEIVNNIKEGKIDFDVLVTSPDMMRELAPIAKVLGPKGLMPSPKAGTVSSNISTTIEEIKKGKVEFRLDKTGNIHGIIGKIDFDKKKLEDNVEAFLQAILNNKPSGVKGKLIKKVVLATSMSPSVQIEAPQK